MEENVKLPPQNIGAEQALLGACLLDKDAGILAQEHVRSTDFYGENHRLIFACIQKLLNSGQPCDLVTVVDELMTAGDLERVGGMAYVASLANAVPSPSSAIHYAKIVAEKAELRALIEAAGLIAANGYSGGYQAGELMELAEKAIFEISERRLHDGFYAIGDLSVEVMEMMANIKANQGVTGIPTFRDLDKLLSGLQKGDLVLVAARPGVGKTSMALNIAQNAAIKHGLTAAIFSLEMPKEQLVQRIICSEAQVDQGRVRSGMASAKDFERISKMLTPLSKAELYLDDSPAITVNEMRSKCRKLKMEKKRLDLVVVDYIQLMSSALRRVENRQQEIADISRSLKALAKELDVPVLALSQLSRLAERTNEPPNLSHLRESGALEQDADVVIFLHRPKKDADEEDGGSANYDSMGVLDVIVAKHRNGPTGVISLAFIKEYTTFANRAQEWVGAPPPESE
jgi:replicative DNA helicase